MPLIPDGVGPIQYYLGLRLRRVDNAMLDSIEICAGLLENRIGPALFYQGLIRLPKENTQSHPLFGKVLHISSFFGMIGDCHHDQE